MWGECSHLGCGVGDEPILRTDIKCGMILQILYFHRSRPKKQPEAARVKNILWEEMSHLCVHHWSPGSGVQFSGPLWIRAVASSKTSWYPEEKRMCVCVCVCDKNGRTCFMRFLPRNSWHNSHENALTWFHMIYHAIITEPYIMNPGSVHNSNRKFDPAL